MLALGKDYCGYVKYRKWIGRDRIYGKEVRERPFRHLDRLSELKYILEVFMQLYHRTLTIPGQMRIPKGFSSSASSLPLCLQTGGS